ncbi:MAG: tetraacyldisaccharide 4'-kinase [Myxococcota bacterium]
MRFRWLESREESFAQRCWLAPLGLLSLGYGVGAAWNRRLHEAGWLSRRQLAAQVVSVGNLVVGGTAKTPLAAWLAAGLRRRGRRVVLASRGYGRRGGEAVEVVSDGRFVRGTAERVGDEPMLLAAKAPGVPVLVGRDRGLVGLRALSAFDAEVIVLDDGFQHHRLARDVDIVSFDGGLGFGNGRVLPRGPLREPAGALRRADAIGVVDGPLPEADEQRLARFAPDAFRFATRRAPDALRQLDGTALDAPASLADAEVGMLVGVAQPRGVRRTLESLGAKVVAERVFPDHHAFRREDLAGLEAEAPRWITTEKDAVKLRPDWATQLDLAVLSIELEVDAPGAFLDWLEARLR